MGEVTLVQGESFDTLNFLGEKSYISDSRKTKIKYILIMKHLLLSVGWVIELQAYLPPTNCEVPCPKSWGHSL